MMSNNKSVGGEKLNTNEKHKTKPTKQLIQSYIYYHYYWPLRYRRNIFIPVSQLIAGDRTIEAGGEPDPGENLVYFKITMPK